jgi:hypothetical protein
MKPATILLAAGAVAASTLATAAQGPLPPAPPAGAGLPAGQCFWVRDIENRTLADRRTLLIKANGKLYRVTTSGNCLAGAVDSDPISARALPGRASICDPTDVNVVVARNGSGAERRCAVDSIVRLSPEEVAALPKRLRP